MTAASLVTRALEVGYGGHSLVQPLDLEVPRGELVALLGANGSGKTTLLRTLAGLLPPVGGAVEVAGADLQTLRGRERARRLSVVLTDRPRAAALTVGDVVALGRHPHTGWGGRLSSTDRECISRAMADLELGGMAQRLVAELSDGELQRVLVARAVAQEPDVLLLDEPTAFLDVQWRSDLVDLLLSLCRRRQISALLSTHDFDLAIARADRIWLFAGDGQLVQGLPEELALDRAYDRLFAGGAARFDVSSGRFVTRAPSDLPHARVLGHGARAVWGQRLLERLGYVVVAADEEGLSIELDCEEHAFRVRTGGETAEVASLGDVARFLNRGARARR